MLSAIGVVFLVEGGRVVSGSRREMACMACKPSK
jgi:hypothetical protein